MTKLRMLLALVLLCGLAVPTWAQTLKVVVVAGDFDNVEATDVEANLRSALESRVNAGVFSSHKDLVVYKGLNFSDPAEAKILQKLGVSRSRLPRLLIVEKTGPNYTKVVWGKPVSDISSDLAHLIEKIGPVRKNQASTQVSSVASAKKEPSNPPPSRTAKDILEEGKKIYETAEGEYEAAQSDCGGNFGRSVAGHRRKRKKSYVKPRRRAATPEISADRTSLW